MHILLCILCRTDVHYCNLSSLICQMSLFHSFVFSPHLLCLLSRFQVSHLAESRYPDQTVDIFIFLYPQVFANTFKSDISQISKITTTLSRGDSQIAPVSTNMKYRSDRNKLIEMSKNTIPICCLCSIEFYYTILYNRKYKYICIYVHIFECSR